MRTNQRTATGQLVAEQLSALAQVDKLLEQAGFDYWLFGGWAVDFYVGALTRRHDDIDLAVWLHEAEAIGSLLETEGWQHKPTAEDDGGTGYECGPVRLELTFLLDDAGKVFIPLRNGRVLWSAEPLGDDARDLRGVRARVVGLTLLKQGKSYPREDPMKRRRTAPTSSRCRAPRHKPRYTSRLTPRVTAPLPTRAITRPRPLRDRTFAV
jgi:hypothetical protein